MSNQDTQNNPQAQAETAQAKPKIFAFVNGGGGGDWLQMSAISEDGYSLAGHLSSSIEWGRHDLGIGSDWKHEAYNKHYPAGWDLVWVDDPRTHSGVQAAVALHNARHEAIDAEVVAMNCFSPQAPGAQGLHDKITANLSSPNTKAAANMEEVNRG